MLKKLLFLFICFISFNGHAGKITKDKMLFNLDSISQARTTHRIYIKNGIGKKIKLGRYTVTLTRIDDRMNRIHLNSKPRNNTLIVEAFDHDGNKMKLEKKGENLSTSSTSNHKYMYKSMPAYIDVK